MNYTIKKTVTAEQINNILDAAMSGMTYWAGEAKPVGKIPEGMNYASEALTNGVYLKVYDSEDEKWYNLTLKKFLKGLSLTDNFDFDNYDMYDADSVVQLALFGEVVYG